MPGAHARHASHRTLHQASSSSNEPDDVIISLERTQDSWAASLAAVPIGGKARLRLDPVGGLIPFPGVYRVPLSWTVPLNASVSVDCQGASLDAQDAPIPGASDGSELLLANCTVYLPDYVWDIARDATFKQVNATIGCNFRQQTAQQFIPGIGMPAHIDSLAVNVTTDAGRQLPRYLVDVNYECVEEGELLSAVGRAVYWKDNMFVTILPAGSSSNGIPTWLPWVIAIGGFVMAVAAVTVVAMRLQRRKQHLLAHERESSVGVANSSNYTAYPPSSYQEIASPALKPPLPLVPSEGGASHNKEGADVENVVSERGSEVLQLLPLACTGGTTQKSSAPPSPMPGTSVTQSSGPIGNEPMDGIVVSHGMDAFRIEDASREHQRDLLAAWGFSPSPTPATAAHTDQGVPVVVVHDGAALSHRAAAVPGPAKAKHTQPVPVAGVTAGTQAAAGGRARGRMAPRSSAVEQQGQGDGSRPWQARGSGGGGGGADEGGGVLGAVGTGGASRPSGVELFCRLSMRPAADNAGVYTGFSNGRKVAVRVTTVSASVEADATSAREEFLTALSALDPTHPHLVQTLAHHTQRVPGRDAGCQVVCLQEFCEGGSVAQMLAAGLYTRPDDGGLRLARIVTTLLHVARALSHLHGHNVAHGGLRPSRVLVQIAPRGASAAPAVGGTHEAPRLADAAAGLDSGSSTCKVAGTALGLLDAQEAGNRVYRAPELTPADAGTPAGDAFAFGVLARELCTPHHVAAPRGTSGRDAQRGDELHARGALDTGGMPALPGTPLNLELLVLACVAASPGERPGMCAATEVLSSVLADLARLSA